MNDLQVRCLATVDPHKTMLHPYMILGKCLFYEAGNIPKLLANVFPPFLKI